MIGSAKQRSSIRKSVATHSHGDQVISVSVAATCDVRPDLHVSTDAAALPHATSFKLTDPIWYVLLFAVHLASNVSDVGVTLHVPNVNPQVSHATPRQRSVLPPHPTHYKLVSVHPHVIVEPE